MRTLAVAERLIEKYLKDGYTVAERAYELVIKVLENEKCWGNYRKITSEGRPCDFFTPEEEVRLSLRKFTLFTYNALYRVGVELSKFREKDLNTISPLRIMIMVEISIIDASKFKEAAEHRERILRRICEGKRMSWSTFVGAGVYILIKKLDFLSDEKLLANLADFMEGLQEWYNTDPAR